MTDAAFEVYKAQALAAGFDEVLVREWKPGQVIATHTHDFDVSARVVRGDVLLVCGEKQRHLHAGDSFELARETPHAEHYGSEGATFWVARKHATA